MTQTIICIKWGTRYPAIYANRLFSMIKRNTSRPVRLVCFTDDAAELDPKIEAHPLPPISLPERVRWTPWRKLAVWQYPLASLEGDILFMDLDVVITGSLDDLFDYKPGAYLAIDNWTQPGKNVGNTSVFRFRAGAHKHIFDDFERDPEAILSRWRIEQQYISDTISSMAFWPKEWCVSFKHSLLPAWPMNFLAPAPLPVSAKVVCFTGKPDPDEARDGVWPVEAVWKRLYKHVRPTPWILEHWR